MNIETIQQDSTGAVIEKHESTQQEKEEAENAGCHINDSTDKTTAKDQTGTEKEYTIDTIIIKKDLNDKIIGVDRIWV